VRGGVDALGPRGGGALALAPPPLALSGDHGT
jgi:hypothetical protein